MALWGCKTVYIGLFLNAIIYKSGHEAEDELEELYSIWLDGGVDIDQEQVSKVHSDKQASAAAARQVNQSDQVDTVVSREINSGGRGGRIIHYGLQQLLSDRDLIGELEASQVNSEVTGRSRNDSRKVLSIEEKKIRKRKNDAKYRNNKKVEYEKLKEEINMLRNRLATQPGIAPSFSTDLLHDLVGGELTVVVEENRSGLNEHQLFMEKLGQDERSRVSHSDLEPLLQGETQDVIEGYRIPLVLLPIYENIVASYGNITGNCFLSSFCSENVLLLFLATIKEMQDTLFEQVTEELIFRWRDSIAEAKRINFNVAFATEHLKKVANSYVARKACNELSSLDKRMEALEAEYNDLRKERLEKQEAYPPELLAASDDFPATVGLF